MKPVLIKGYLSLTVGGRNLEFPHQNLSTSGVSGLQWGPLDPEEYFGARIRALIRIPARTPFAIQTDATITREETAYAKHMGLKFHLEDADRERLSKQIEEQGFYPTEYIRKFPRIPSTHIIQTFPLYAIVSPASADGEKEHHAFDVENLSPNGTLISTENQMSRSIVPNSRLDISLEPRGWFPMPIKMQGIVCRIMDERSDANQNFVRHLGVKFTQFDDPNRLAFVDLLKDILEGYKKITPAG